MESKQKIGIVLVVLGFIFTIMGGTLAYINWCSSTNTLIKLDNQQKDAACTIDGAILVLAVPGSGKTTTLISHINYMVKDCKTVVDFFNEYSVSNKHNQYCKKKYEPGVWNIK